ncbi:dynamin family protein [Lentimicrobium sp. S6]|uniref:dynamin family protein n=1 Tax=Lentimicrobium sp. S6 TaxID=2735872 RepID=UPI001557006A|nr:dynamin family protein [Lentimicrobium sp. S6]NPD46904.1 hypothetical protein [Lentimicrobium sp. S6]
MGASEAINILKEEVEINGFPIIRSIEYLNNEEPVIYLCGKSSTGKTTFLNALFNMKKDELFTSTDISTKTEFRFKKGTEENIIRSDNSIISIPIDYIDRKELFKSLNTVGEKYLITLNQKALKGRTIVDIPGVFDFSRNNDFSNKMIDEANIVYFFSPCRAKTNPFEYELLKSISEAGIPIIVLFTMGDDTDPDEGVTRKTIPKLVKNRLGTSFKGINVSHHQIISSNDFYKGRDNHGIDQLQLHISSNDEVYKKTAEENRLIKTTKYYLSLTEDKLAKLSIDSDTYINLVNRENELWFETEKKKVDDERYKSINGITSELNWLQKICEDGIYGKNFSKLYSMQNLSLKEQKEKFELNWEEFWRQLGNDNELLNFSIPLLPILSENLFEQISIDIDKFKEVIGEKTDTETKPDSEDKENKKDNSSKESDNKEMSLTDFMEVAIEIGVNLSNGKILFNKWLYLSNLSKKINDAKNDIIQQCNIEFNNRTNKLVDVKKQRIEAGIITDPTLEDTATLNKALTKFKSIINDIRAS